MRVSETDPRSIRTRHQLRETLMQLAAERHFPGLTIQEVTRAAGLNRTTFYRHYSGLPELLEDCARTLFAHMRTEIYAQGASPLRGGSTELVPYVECVFRHLERHERFYRAMLGRQGDPLFRGLFQELLSELIFEPITSQTLASESNPRLEMNLRFFAAGFTGVAAWWLERGRPISATEASLQVAQDILPDYLRLMGEGR